MIPPESTERQLGALPLASRPSTRARPALPRPPLVLLEQHTAKLCQRIRSDIIECPENAFAIFDGECDYVAVERKRLLEEGTGRLVHERDELAYVLVGNPQTGEIHGGEPTRWGRDS